MTPQPEKPSSRRDGARMRASSRRTSWKVHFADRLMSGIIRVGGVGVIVAVLGILVYLAAVTLPLFSTAQTSPLSRGRLPFTEPPLFVSIDEHRTSVMWLDPEGVLRAAGADTGEVYFERRLPPDGRTLTAFSRGPRDSSTALGYDDGSVQAGEAEFRTSFLPPEREGEFTDLLYGETAVTADGVVQRVEGDRLRVTSVRVEMPEPAQLEEGEGAVVRLDFFAPQGAGTQVIAALREDGTGALNSVRVIRPLTGEAPRLRLTPRPLTIVPPSPGAGLPDHLFSTPDAHAFAVWNDGAAQRYAVIDSEAMLVESFRVTEPGVRVTDARMLLASRTLLIGDERGGVSCWFAAPDNRSDAPDRLTTVRGHDFPPSGSPVVSVRPTSRDRMIAVSTADGALRVRHITSHKLVAQIGTGLDDDIATGLVAPKTDALFAFADTGEWRSWAMDPGHPDATFRSIFGKVWYEGAPEPQYVYQSSSGDDAAEVKLSLTPLIMGSLKATVYAMLFAVPLAVLAAIFTSEFLHPRVRLAVKPVVEVMASLPSVVLGFIVGLIIAPIVAPRIGGVLLALVYVPFLVMLAGYVWQLLPVRIDAMIPSRYKLAIIGATVMSLLLAALAAGPVVERALFSPSENDVLALAGSVEPVPPSQWPEWLGRPEAISSEAQRELRSMGLYFRDGVVVRPVGSLDDPEIAQRARERGYTEASVIQWLNGVIGGPWPGWFLLAFPIAVPAVTLLRSRLADNAIESATASSPRLTVAVVDLVKMTLTLLGAFGAAAIFAWALTGAGLDPRDSIFGPFSIRNTLIVGIGMGFAVIPIIYTIAEDALSRVPDQLRSASLGSGATRWQTAVRVILPMALSGIFSACMIGFGRAVGETMIVLMATGNTPTMDWNIFSGFRTLSANIAVELPEAPKDSTHYRVLFLCGLVLFAITFVINTFAELVRQRFRAKAASV